MLARRTHPNYADLNIYFEHIKSKIQKKKIDLRQLNPDFTFFELKAALRTILNENNSKKSNFFDIFELFIESKKTRLSGGTLKHYKVLKNHLSEFSNKTGYSIEFKTINHDFHDKFVAFLLKEKKHVNNTARKHIKMLKTFLNWVVERSYSTNLDYQKFGVKEDEVDVLYLTKDELMRIYNLDLSTLPRLEKIRDVFCFQCFTGQRFSDVAAITPDDIHGDFWHVRTQKAREVIKVPLTEKAKKILVKYFGNGEKLPVISNQKTNDYLKQLGKLAEIDEPTKIVRYRGAKRIEISKPKYEFITTHIARKTFVTLSLELGMRPEVVMNVTGHNDYKTMKRYLKIASAVSESEMKRAWG